MSFGKKFLIAFFLFISTISTVYADFIWPAYYFLVAGFIPAWVIIGGLIIETGFVKYFTKVSYRKAILVSVLMNLVSAILGGNLLLDWIDDCREGISVYAEDFAEWMVCACFDRRELQFSSIH